MNESRILAAMGHLNVTEADVDAMIASLGQRGKNYNTPEGRRIVLDQLINQKLILLDATRNLLEREPEFKAQLAKVKDDLLVNYAVSKTLASVRVTEEEIQKYYAENPDDFRSEKAVNASHILVADETEAKDILAKIQAGEITFEEAAKKRLEIIIPQLAKAYGVTEQLKAENQIEWVRQMNACVAQAEETIKGELIYC